MKKNRPPYQWKKITLHINEKNIISALNCIPVYIILIETYTTNNIDTILDFYFYHYTYYVCVLVNHM
jgi:hypothetical protein